MRAWLCELLVCPACLPEEIPLSLEERLRRGQEVLAGSLACPGCGRTYGIEDGLADLVPGDAAAPPAQARYDRERLAASYLWSHYADLWDDPEATRAYEQWLAMAGDVSGPALDAGCAVGRFTLELAARTGQAVGIDLSRSFVALARQVAADGGLAFAAPLQGLLTRTFSFALPERLRQGTVEFVRADALRPPFRRSSFGTVASLNVLDKVPAPDRHLDACCRVLAAPGVLLVADPFSWSPDIAPPEAWLGGTPETGDSAACLAADLDRRPGLSARIAGHAWWALRDHANRYERIRSEVVVARKSQT